MASYPPTQPPTPTHTRQQDYESIHPPTYLQTKDAHSIHPPTHPPTLYRQQRTRMGGSGIHRSPPRARLRNCLCGDACDSAAGPAHAAQSPPRRASSRGTSHPPTHPPTQLDSPPSLYHPPTHPPLQAQATEGGGGDETGAAQMQPLPLPPLSPVEEQEDRAHDEVRYLVKWRGLPYDQASWERWADIKEWAFEVRQQPTNPPTHLPNHPPTHAPPTPRFQALPCPRTHNAKEEASSHPPTHP